MFCSYLSDAFKCDIFLRQPTAENGAASSCVGSFLYARKNN